MRLFFAYRTHLRPTGGKKQIRLYASLLRNMGFESFIVQDEQWAVDPGRYDDSHLYGIDVPYAPFTIGSAKEHLESHDVLILPEVRLYETLDMVRDWNVRVGVFNQNGFNSIRHRPTRTRLKRRIEFVLAISPYTAAVSHRILGVPWQRIFVIPPWIVRDPVSLSRTSGESPLSIACMPRKLPRVVDVVRDSVMKRHPDVPWVDIDGLSERDAIATLKRSQVFLSTQHREGCPAPALEAMVSGLLVAGFPGTGRFPHPYATPQNGVWVCDGDVQGAVSAVCRAVHIARDRDERYEELVQAGHRTGSMFGYESVSESLRFAVEIIRHRHYDARADDRHRLGIAGTIQLFQEAHAWERYHKRLGRAKRFVVDRVRRGGNKES